MGYYSIEIGMLGSHVMYSITLKSGIPYNGNGTLLFLPKTQSPRISSLSLSIFPPIPKPSSVPKQRTNFSFSLQNDTVCTWESKSHAVKTVDVATLGNLCVDIVLNVPELPPHSPDHRKAYMDQLAASPPHKNYWEAGGNCNMAIAAARLGLCCLAIGHVGDETYGQFLVDVLHDEKINLVGMTEETDVVEGSSALYETLLCWVLVDPLQRHGFCSGCLFCLSSRADFSKEPAFSWMSKLSGKVKMAIKQSRILFCNGYGFDEFTPGMITSALEYAIEVGTSVFFDPGPRGKSLSSGTPEERRALNQFLRMSDVILVTSDEAESLTGIRNPILAGQELLSKGTRTKWVIVKMGAKGSILITVSSVSCAPTFKVNVVDTVGCGDSFVAAIAFGFIHDMPMVNTLAIANAVGAATAMGCGAGRNVATLEQVIELMRGSNLNEDDEFWNDLLNEKLDTPEITYLTKTGINGSSNRLHHVSLDKVVSELLPKLESTQLESNVSS
ncbi:PfkB domain-containing protein [Cephalotus follicularis]|uniref:PfkB domain-containing protein n=1 Tax=Cephalotus follicularis TaxID=3775 RepID=A0A1Q3ATQ8_CEPFO|nr:PfkB domain-containing protein [Cephalotus follicularis]